LRRAFRGAGFAAWLSSAALSSAALSSAALLLVALLLVALLRAALLRAALLRALGRLRVLRLLAAGADFVPADGFVPLAAGAGPG
jgi:hypothetical protein